MTTDLAGSLGADKVLIPQPGTNHNALVLGLGVQRWWGWTLDRAGRPGRRIVAVARVEEVFGDVPAGVAVGDKSVVAMEWTDEAVEVAARSGGCRWILSSSMDVTQTTSRLDARLDEVPPEGPRRTIATWSMNGTVHELPDTVCAVAAEQRSASASRSRGPRRARRSTRPTSAGSRSSAHTTTTSSPAWRRRLGCPTQEYPRDEPDHGRHGGQVHYPV